MSIFVQIASYRDPELIPTVQDLLLKADNPGDIDICIAWQHSEDETIDAIKNLPNVQIIDIPWNQSKGLCWARSLIQKQYKDQSYTLQLDSHHRFVKGWDTELISMMHLTNSPKPIITSYAGMYSPKGGGILLNTEPYKMVASNFTDSGTILFRPQAIPSWQSLTKPIPARFVSGHFFFTLGQHCCEYHYDPNIYFAGDEISLSIRSYTLGYDLFHPHKLVVWHEYTREGRTKHWSDFNAENKDKKIVDKPWWEMDSASKHRLRHMLQEEDNNIDLGIYGLGNIRSHSDYEKYAGINFKTRQLHPVTLAGDNPPVNDNSEWWLKPLQEYEINLANMPLIENFKFIYVGIESKEGKVLYREDITEYKSNLTAKFKSTEKPYKWIIWPVNNNGEWYNRQDIIL